MIGIQEWASLSNLFVGFLQALNRIVECTMLAVRVSSVLDFFVFFLSEEIIKKVLLWIYVGSFIILWMARNMLDLYQIVEVHNAKESENIPLNSRREFYGSLSKVFCSLK